jgi:hypothetical protein
MAFQPSCAPVGAIATQIYNPAAVGTPAVSIFNNGSVTAYIGGSSVTAGTGFPLPSGQGFDLPNLSTGLWAVAGTGTLGSATTLTVSAAQYAGTVNATSTAGYAAGETLQIGAGAAAETAIIGTIPSGTTVVFTSGLRFAHGSGEALALVSAPLGTSLNVLAGTR